MTIKNLAIVFPGQGSQYVGMGKDFYDKFDLVKEYFSIMNSAKNKDISDMIFNGSPEDLKQTEIAQISIYTLSIAIFELLKIKNIIPSFVAGHSLGEYTALTASEVFSFKDGINLVSKRGEFIKNACNIHKGGMFAVIGMEEEKINEIVAQLVDKKIEIEIANYNSPGQIVLSYKGDTSTVKEITDCFNNNGAKRLIELNVSGPFHSSFMNTASESLKIELEKIDLKNPKIPIVFNYNANEENDIFKMKNCILNQVNHSVQWIKTVNYFVNNGIDTIIEVGPGKVLSGLNKKIDKNLKIYNIENLETFESVVNVIE